MIEKLKKIIQRRKSIEEKWKEFSLPWKDKKSKVDLALKDLAEQEESERAKILEAILKSQEEYDSAVALATKYATAGDFKKYSEIMENTPAPLTIPGVSLRVIRSVEITGEIPDEYYKRVPDMEKIKSSTLKQGNEIPGVTVTEGYSLTVRV